MQMTSDTSTSPTPRDDFGDGFPAFDEALEAPAALAECKTPAERLDYLRVKTGGVYTRKRLEDGRVRIRLKLPEEDVLSVTAATTDEAVSLLLTKAGVTQ